MGLIITKIFFLHRVIGNRSSEKSVFSIDRHHDPIFSDNGDNAANS